MFWVGVRFLEVSGSLFSVLCSLFSVLGSRFSVRWACRGAEERTWVGEGEEGVLGFWRGTTNFAKGTNGWGSC
jgi:hypothetical protein